MSEAALPSESATEPVMTGSCRAWRPFDSVPLMLVAFHFLVGTAFAHALLRPGLTGADALLSMAVSVLAVLACAADARQRGSPLPHGVQYVMLLTWPITAPLYLLQSRGWKGVAWTAASLVTLLVCAVGALQFAVLLKVVSG